METKQATFAAGCFWGVEAAFAKIPGVLSTTVGYTGGQPANPTYRQVCTGRTDHAEAVLVTYDRAVVSFAELLDAFWSCHDPTTVDRQGPDIGSQYRSAIFFHDVEQERIARASLKEVEDSGVFRRKIVTQIVAAAPFYPAEDYHQQYFVKQGLSQSCHVGVVTVQTRLARTAELSRPAAAASTAVAPSAACGTSHWKQLSDAQLRKRLTPEQYAVARQAGTERAFSGRYWNEHRNGVYRCAICGQPLFSSEAKFDSGTGWPSYWKAIDPAAVAERSDDSHGMKRVEAVCSRCESHLGHVFDDGPDSTGKRYCINSAVLDLAVEG